MNKYIIFIALILYGLCFPFFSCGKYPTGTGSPYGDAVLANNLIIIDSIRGIDLYSIDPQSGIYTFKIEDKYNAIAVGDIIIGTAFNGFIRRVTGRTRDRKILELQTEDATLADVIKSGGIDTAIYISTGTAQKYSKVELVSAAKGVSISDQGIDLSGLSLYPGVTEGVNIDVNIVDGFISFNPKIDYGFAFNSKGLSHFHTIVSGALNYDYNLEILANGKFGMTGLKTIADFSA